MLRVRLLLMALAVLANGLTAQFAVDELTRLGDYESRRASSYDRTGANGDYRHLKPGETMDLFSEDGPAEIRHIWITMATGEAYHLKKVVLRMYWDGEAEPSVEAPIGDFFGLGLGTYAVFHSALVVVAPDKALNAYFPMPFARRGRITVTNEGGQEITDFYWNIDWVKLPALPTDTAYFHAQYRQAAPHSGWYHGNFYGNDFTEARQDPRWLNASGKDNYVFLEARGDGHFVGVALSVFQNQWGGWNEGDEMIWVDGETEPRIHGTGGEDYFNGAWGFSQLYSFPLVGLTEFHGWEPGARFSHYRFHLEAPVRFRKSVKVTIEDGHANLRSDNLYSVAYWYQTEPHAKFPALPAAELRIPKFVSVGGPGQDKNMK
ncbi:MAG TPA: glycoside hydrolase family 172 protein [Burkholderiales bacterium]|nr:glycoside hydrolase family 172 protein [Burkholderiales bacterium]